MLSRRDKQQEDRGTEETPITEVKEVIGATEEAPTKGVEEEAPITEAVTPEEEETTPKQRRE